MSHRLRTTLRTRQPLPLLQHPHQSDYCHLTLSFTDHTEEELWGGGQVQVTKNTKEPHKQFSLVSRCNRVSFMNLSPELCRSLFQVNQDKRAS